MYIYKISHVFNDKCYVGQTTGSVNYRFYCHKRKSINYNSLGKNEKSKPCPKLHYAFLKYGYENFKIEILDTAKTKEELDEKEMRWIKLLDSVDNGYNLTYGGRGVGELSSESKRKISISKLGNSGRAGKKNSPEHRKMHSIRMTKDNPTRGKPAINRKKVKCITNGKIYESIRAARIDLKIGCLHKHLIGKTKHVGGFQFEYYSESVVI